MTQKRRPTAKNFRNAIRTRLVLVALALFLFVGGLTARLFSLQILHHEELLAKSERQYAGTKKILYGRGSIFDRNQNELAMNIEVESVYITPSKIKNKSKTVRALASYLNLDKERLRGKILSHKNFVWIKRKCSLKEADKLKQLDLPGVGFIAEQKRFYPKRELASNVTGFVGLDNQGLSGVEHYRHGVLKGRTVRKVMAKDARGRYIRSSNRSQKPKSQDVVLTLDEVIQYTAEYHLKKQVEKFDAESGMAVVMDPYSGEIYALANYPQFNPNKYAAYPSHRWKNSVVSSSYEPGSIFKPIVAAAALETGVAKRDDIFFCENGKFNVGKTHIGEAENHKFGWLSLTDIISKSSNIGSIKIAQRLGNQTFFNYIKKFGFGDKLGVDLPGEQTGQLRPLSKWDKLSLASISFGQEIAVTPIQIVAALAAIANGGNLVVPHITKAVLKNGTLVESTKTRTIRRVISETTSQQMVDILKHTVKHGTGKNAAIPGFEAAGKTGTAQKFDASTQSYSKTDFLSSFIGFVPADDPKIVVLVMIDKPRKNYWGGVVAAPVFREISKETLRYLNVPSQDEKVYFLNKA